MVWQKQGTTNALFGINSQSTEEKNCQLRIFYPEKLSFRNEVQIKTLPKKLRESISDKSISKFLFPERNPNYFFK